MLSFLFSGRRTRACSFPFALLVCLLLNALINACGSPEARAAGVVNVPTEAALDAAMQGGGLVTFACDGVIPITSVKNAGPGVDGTTSLTLDATGHNITLDGGGKVRLLHNVFLQGPSAPIPNTLTIKHLTLANGGNTNAGGAIDVEPGATLTIDGCTFVNNKSTGGGGALYVFAATKLTITNTVFRGNQVDSRLGTDAFSYAVGGAVHIDMKNVPPTYVTFTNYSFLNNSVTTGENTSAYGGALDMGADTATLSNCTFAGNRAVSMGTKLNTHGAIGGAVCCAPNSANSNILFLNCTLANNAAIDAAGDQGRGGGIYVETLYQEHVTLTNTLLANNAATTSDGNFSSYSAYGGNTSSSALIDGGHNLCSDGSCVFTTATSKDNSDARLGPPVYTGNSVPTLPLLAGSPAIDAGDDSQAPLTDARGAGRQGGHSDIGAYERAVWQAEAVAVGADNHARVLWNKSDGTVNVWSVNNSNGTVISLGVFAPGGDWTARALAVGTDNITHVLWTTPAGQMKAWSISAAGVVTSTPVNGPFADWRAVGLSVGSDNNMRVLWTTPAGMMSLWNMDAKGHATSSPSYGPFADWQAVGIGASGSLTQALWTTPDGQMSLWSVNSGGSVVNSSPAYGPFADWQAVAFGSGGALSPILWVTLEGQMSTWNVNGGGSIVNSSPAYGPYTGWAATAISGGGDGKTRVAWSSLNGALNLWSIVPASGVVASSYTFGPF